MANDKTVNNLINRTESIFRHRYAVLDRLGKGGMGMVFLVQGRDLGQKKYALKIVDKASPENKGVDVYSEIRMLRDLHHPNIVGVIEALEDERYVYIIQDYVEGRTLAELRDDPAASAVIDEETVRLWMLDIADALAYIHSQGIIHRDLKPGNIMINSEGSAILIDFGIARRVSTIRKMRSGFTVGSAPYSPLERLQGQTDNEQTDIYAYGTTFYSLLRRNVPSLSGREINTLRTNNQSIEPYYMNAYRTMIGDLAYIQDDGLREIIRECVEIDPRLRIRDFNSIRYRLRSIDEVKVEHDFRKKEVSKGRSVWIVLLIIGILLSGFGIVQAIRDHGHRYDKLIAAADEACDTGDYALGEKAADEAIAFDPNGEAGYIRKYKAITGSAYEQSDVDEYARLIREIKSDAEELPSLKEDMYAATYLANAYYETEDYDEAISTLENFGERLEDEQLMLLGQAYYQRKENDSAMECLERMSKDTSGSLYLEGLINEGSAPDKAIACYRAVMKKEEADSGLGDLKRRALSQIVQIHMNRGDFGMAIKEINDAMASNTAYAESTKINLMLLDCYYRSENYSGAVQQADKLLVKANNRGAFGIKVSSQENLKQYSDALYTIGEWEEAYPDDPTPHVQRAMIYNRIASAAKSDSQRVATYTDFIDAYEEELAWLKKHNAVTDEFLTLEQSYYDAKNILEQIRSGR